MESVVKFGFYLKRTSKKNEPSLVTTARFTGAPVNGYIWVYLEPAPPKVQIRVTILIKDENGTPQGGDQKTHTLTREPGGFAELRYPFYTTIPGSIILALDMAGEPIGEDTLLVIRES